MTKPQPVRTCVTCGCEFRKAWTHERHCSAVCAISGRIAQGDPDDCWLWTGATNSSGYAQINRGGRRLYVHRLAYEAARGPIPAGLHLCHRCDNPPCCNPRHLFPGTAAANMADMRRKGRWKMTPARGSVLPFSKLDEALVARIRREHTAGEKQVALAARYNISKSQVGNIVHRRSWRHVE